MGVFNVNRNSSLWKVIFFHTFFFIATFKTHFDQVIWCWQQQCCIFLWQSIPAMFSSLTISLCGILWCKNNSFLLPMKHIIDSAVLLGQCFLFWISGHFLSSPLISTLKSPTLRSAFIFPYRKKKSVFCESPFFPKWSGCYFQNLASVPFPEDCIKTWVIQRLLSAYTHTHCTTPSSSHWTPLLHFKLWVTSVQIPLLHRKLLIAL